MRYSFFGGRPATTCWLLVGFFFLSVTPPAGAVIKVNDHFDTGELDPAWNITLDLVSGWTYEVASSWLTVSEILFDEMHGEWSTVSLDQEFDPLDDFTVHFDLGWDSGESNRAMQNLGVVLYDLKDEYVIYASYHDAWDGNVGRVTTIIGESVFDGQNILPHSGIGSFEIVRAKGLVSIFWDDVEVQTGALESPIKKLELRFQVGAWPTATFGELSVDLVSCEGEEATPTQNSAWGRVKILYR